MVRNTDLNQHAKLQQKVITYFLDKQDVPFTLVSIQICSVDGGKSRANVDYTKRIIWRGDIKASL